MTSHASLESSRAAQLEQRAAVSGMIAAACAAFGVLASGPGAMLLVARIHAQPPWISPEVFVMHFHPIQILPFMLGFFLVAGFLGLITSMHVPSGPPLRAVSAMAWAAALVFATLVFLNYIVQTTFIPALVHNYRQANGPLLAALTMAQPSSLGWSLEMWGYAFLGLSTWLIAPFFAGAGAERVARWTFIANGPLSIVAAIWTALQPGWEFTGIGFSAFAAWNVLAFVMYPEPIAVHAEDTLPATAARMAKRGVRHACVVDRESRLIGIVSDRDVRRAFGDPRLALAPGHVPEHLQRVRIGQLMSKPHFVEADATVGRALSLLLAHHVGALPVVDAEQKLCGIVSYVDLLKHFAGTPENRID